MLFQRKVVSLQIKLETKENMEEKDFLEALFPTNEKEKNPIEALIGMMRSPIAKRKGLFISAKDCEEWALDLEKFLSDVKKCCL